MNVFLDQTVPDTLAPLIPIVPSVEVVVMVIVKMIVRVIHVPWTLTVDLSGLVAMEHVCLSIATVFMILLPSLLAQYLARSSSFVWSLCVFTLADAAE